MCDLVSGFIQQVRWNFIESSYFYLDLSPVLEPSYRIATPLK